MDSLHTLERLGYLAKYKCEEQKAEYQLASEIFFLQHRVYQIN